MHHLVFCPCFRRSQTPNRDRYQSPDPRRSYRPSVVTRKSVIAIANAEAAAQAQAAAAASPQRVRISTLPPDVNLTSSSPSRNQKVVSCC